MKPAPKRCALVLTSVLACQAARSEGLVVPPVPAMRLSMQTERIDLNVYAFDFLPLAATERPVQLRPREQEGVAGLPASLARLSVAVLLLLRRRRSLVYDGSLRDRAG